MDKLEGLLFRLGIYKCQEGYDCIWTAMELVEEDETLLRRLMGGLYAATAARCGNTRTRVERNIRSSIAKAWEANPEYFSQIAHRTITQPPTSGDFLCMLHEYLREQKMEAPCTGLSQNRIGTTPSGRCFRFRGKGRHRLAAGPFCGAVSGLVRGGLENGRNLPCVPGYLAL